MRHLFRFLLTSAVVLLGVGQSQAQQTPVAAVDSVAKDLPPAAGAVDVIVRTSGAELPAQVLRVTPRLVRYLPPFANLPGATPADTLTLLAADVRLIRYADGTRQVLPLTAGDPAPVTTLLGLSTEQRYAQGRRDSHRYYKPSAGVFWGTLGGTAVTGVGGLAVGTAVVLNSPPRQSLILTAPTPILLDDPAYYKGYSQQAKERKLGKAVAGLGIGVGNSYYCDQPALSPYFRFEIKTVRPPTLQRGSTEVILVSR